MEKADIGFSDRMDRIFGNPLQSCKDHQNTENDGILPFLPLLASAMFFRK
jgi:hypothetical protein